MVARQRAMGMSSTAAAAAALSAVCQKCQKDLRLPFIVFALSLPPCQQIDLKLCVCGFIQQKTLSENSLLGSNKHNI